MLLGKKIAIFVSNTSRMSSLAPYSNIWYTNFIDPPFSTSFGPPYCTQLWLDSSDRILCIQNYTSTIQHLALFSIAGLTSTQIFFSFFLFQSNWHLDCSMHSYILTRLGEIFHRVNCEQIEPTHKKWPPTIGLVILFPISLIPSTLE